MARRLWVDSSRKKLEPGSVCRGYWSELKIMGRKILTIVVFWGTEISLGKK